MVLESIRGGEAVQRIAEKRRGVCFALLPGGLGKMSQIWKKNENDLSCGCI